MLMVQLFIIILSVRRIYYVFKSVFVPLVLSDGQRIAYHRLTCHGRTTLPCASVIQCCGAIYRIGLSRAARINNGTEIVNRELSGAKM